MPPRQPVCASAYSAWDVHLAWARAWACGLAGLLVAPVPQLVPLGHAVGGRARQHLPLVQHPCLVLELVQTCQLALHVYSGVTHSAA